MTSRETLLDGLGREIFGGCLIEKVVMRLLRVPGVLSSSELKTRSMRLAGARYEVTLQQLSLFVESAPLFAKSSFTSFLCCILFFCTS